MPVRAVLLLLLLASRAAGAAGEPPVTVVKVAWPSTQQTIVGFGGTLGWIHPAPAQREQVFDLLFKDLGATVLRVQALGGEGGDEVTPEPVNDNDDPHTFAWSRFKFKETEARCAATVRDAQARGVKTIIPVTWSPPGWMKTRPSRVGGELPAAMAAEYAELWTAFVLSMRRDFRLELPYLSIQNEPDLTYVYPTCRIEPAAYARCVAILSARLKQEGLPTAILGPDTCRIYNLPPYVEALEKEKLTAGPILTHLYDLQIPFADLSKEAERWRTARTFAARRQRPLWLMETANYLSDVNRIAGTWAEALIWAQKIHWALVEGHCEVVCYWALFFDKLGESLVYCEKSAAESYTITPKFYTSKNYYRFVRPGMQRCAVTCDNPDVLVSAFRGAGDRAPRVLVLINPGAQARTVACAALAAGDWERFETSATKKCEPLAPVKGVPTILLPAESVTTLRSTTPLTSRD